MNRAVPSLALAFALFGAAGSLRAETRFLPGAARELSLRDSATRDAPVIEYAHGRRAYGSLGVAPGIVSFSGGASELTIGLSLLFAWEDDAPKWVLPRSLLWRDREALSFALALPKASHAAFGRGALAEIGVELGHEGAHRDPGASVDPWRSTDIAFGAGGYFIAPDVALRLPAGARFTLTSRLGDRIYANALPRMVGVREASDVVADYLGEGLLHAPFFGLDFVGRARSGPSPVLSLWGEALVAHDDNARDGVRSRLLAGVALRGRAGELLPYAAIDAGNGYGYFVNRRELQFSLGVRLSFETEKGQAQ
jgi:hypothetical protein